MGSFTNKYFFTVSTRVHLQTDFISLQFQQVYKRISFLYNFKESSFANRFYFFTVSKSEVIGLPCEIIMFITMVLKSHQPHWVTSG